MDRGRLEKRMSYWLRHNPSDIGIELDINGWTDLINFSAKTQIDTSIIEDIVSKSSKQRFTIKDGKIRASQGHTVKLEIEFTEVTPPDLLYHGTAEKFLSSIIWDGLKPMSRHHVHLSKDLATARQVGSRRGASKVLLIDAKQMVIDGHKFWISDNGVYLTEFVDPQYIIGVQ